LIYRCVLSGLGVFVGRKRFTTEDTEPHRVLISVLKSFPDDYRINADLRRRVPDACEFFPSPIRGRLDAVKLGVLTALGHQLFMSAHFDDPRSVEHDDKIRHADGAEPM